MAGTDIKTITNANLYLNGTSFLGKAAEVTLPDVKATYADHPALGLFGKVEFPTGMDKLEATIKMNGLYPELIKLAANPFASVEIMVRAVQETFDGNGRSKQSPVLANLVGTFKSNPGGGFKQHEKVDASYTLSITACNLEIDGAQLFNVDALANIWTVDGVDLLADYRAALGI
jgi:hypothetical protein